MTKFQIGRRTFLRGAAAWVALPALDAMMNSHGTAYADGSAIPRKFVLWFFGNGVHPERWVPTATGPSWAPSDQLMPLGDPALKRYVNVISGLEVKTSTQAHAGGTTAILSGGNMIKVPCTNDCTAILPTIDQVLARSIAGSTPFKTLELGCARPQPAANDPILNALSLGAPTSLNRAQRDPRKVFSRLFGSPVPGNGGAALQADVRRSVLDGIISDAAAVRHRLGAVDRKRLDGHLEGIRVLEERLGRLPSACNPRAPTSISDADLSDESAHYTEINLAMSELGAMALACDLTRVVTYMFTSPASHNTFKEIGIGQSFHGLTHAGPSGEAKVHAGVVYEMQRLADTLRVFRGTPIGAGNLLDASCVFVTSCCALGTSHSCRDYPILLVGRAGGALKYPGVHHRSGSRDTTSRAGLTILRAMGVPAASFGGQAGVATSPIGDVLEAA